MRSLIYLSIATLVMSLVAFGQTTPPPNGFGTTTLTADLSPQNLVPPMQDRTESGRAEVEITIVSGGTGASDSAVVNFEITLENAQAETFTGFAIHEGATGLNGSPVIQAQLDATEPPAMVNTISGQLMVAGSSQLDALRDVLENPEGHYVLLTAEGHPSGLLRGQLSADDDPGGVENLSDKVDRIQDQLDTIQLMVHRIGRILGIAPELLPLPEGQTPDNGNGNGNTTPTN